MVVKERSTVRMRTFLVESFDASVGGDIPTEVHRSSVAMVRWGSS